ncbi:MAG: AAA family ATPase [Candidatus Omnitrophica bacterium]|nr:AAA family ATPase [Candidatus Omnitrophota bacterium]
MEQDRIKKTPEFLRAFDLLENSGKCVFLTGRAGTGKSTFLQYFRGLTAKNVAVLAPTGVAAVNVRGQTIHSFFKFRPDITPEKALEIRLRRAQREVYRHLDALVIDEISMVRADLLDCMDVFLRAHGRDAALPFGGVQMIFIGDLHQLPPVVLREERAAFEGPYAGPYFFHARVFPALDLKFLELEMIYRQKEDRFIRLLNAVRENVLTSEHLKLLNSRVDPGFNPPDGEFYVYLTTTNDLADRINVEKLRAIKSRVYAYAGIVNGAFEARVLPTQEQLELKFGAQVMLLNNDPAGRWVNGSIGQVTDIIHGDGDDAVRVKLIDGETVDVAPFTWEVHRFVYDEDRARLVSEPVGAFTQYPLRLAWAVTIHKAQGKTFDRVIIDTGRGAFASGQIYVALSRCTSLEGIVLKRPVFLRDIQMDPRVADFLQNFKKVVSAKHIVLE